MSPANPPPGPALSARFLADAEAMGGRAIPPVERWNPPFCGDIDMKIARDGRWYYLGSPITRMPLVKLFASILRKDEDRHVLVTPVERVGIIVEDAPFLAVEMEVAESPEGDTLAFRTNVDDLVFAGSDHPVSFQIEPGGGVKPYILVRGGLQARLTRALTLDLLDRIIEIDGRIAVQSGSAVFYLPEGVRE